MLVGLLWGAPLIAGELELGTHQMVWTQGITRTRWATVKIGLAVIVALLAGTLYGLGMVWWSYPLSLTGSRLGVFFFDMQGLAPIGYSVFAVALGIWAGTVWRGTLAAMGVTLAGFIAVRVPVALVARPSFLPARTREYVETMCGQDCEAGAEVLNPRLGDWVLERMWWGSDGTLIPDGATMETGAGVTLVERYHPGSAFWSFQAMYLALAGLLLRWALRRIRRLA